MKLSISNIAWDTKDNASVFQLMEKYGFSGLEIAPTKLVLENPYDHIDEAKKYAEALYKDHSLVIPSMQSIWYGRNEKIFGSEGERESLLEYTKKAIDYASAIGCHNLVFGCPRNRNINDMSDYDIAVSFFKEIGNYAYSKHTCIGMEANPPIYNTNFINDTVSAMKLIEDVGSKGFLLNLDIGTMIYNQEKTDILSRNTHLINHVHVSEPHLKLIERRNIHAELKELLIANNYTGYISIEMGLTDDLHLIEGTMKYVREVFG